MGAGANGCSVGWINGTNLFTYGRVWILKCTYVGSHALEAFLLNSDFMVYTSH